MGRNQILRLIACGFTYLSYLNGSATAGWFGPSDYNECVLDEMKGQPAYMKSYAKNACRNKFPCPDGQMDPGIGVCMAANAAQRYSAETDKALKEILGSPQ